MVIGGVEVSSVVMGTAGHCREMPHLPIHSLFTWYVRERERGREERREIEDE